MLEAFHVGRCHLDLVLQVSTFHRMTKLRDITIGEYPGLDVFPEISPIRQDLFRQYACSGQFVWASEGHIHNGAVGLGYHSLDAPTGAAGSRNAP